MQVVTWLLTCSVFVHVYASRFFFLFFSLCFCFFVCVFFLFYGSLWSDSNKERFPSGLKALGKYEGFRSNFRSRAIWRYHSAINRIIALYSSPYVYNVKAQAPAVEMRKKGVGESAKIELTCCTDYCNEHCMHCYRAQYTENTPGVSDPWVGFIHPDQRWRWQWPVQRISYQTRACIR